MPKRPSTGALTSPCLEREGGIGDRAVDHRGLGDGAEIDVGVLQAALGGERREGRALGELLGRGLGLVHVREHDLLELAPLRRLVARLAVLVGLLQVGVGNFDPRGEIRRRQRQRS